MNSTSRGSSPVPPSTWRASQPHQVAVAPPPPAFDAAQAYGAPDCQQPVKPKRDVELWLGQYAVGVIAAVLVFLGAAYFALAIIPQFTDEMKVLLMFVLSIALTAVGSGLAIVRQNGFTTALMGCGAGSLFISVLVTHLYFGMLPELPAFGLLLVWMVLCLALVRRTQSLLLDIVLQLGLTVSVCLGFASGFDGGRLWLLVGYQLVASIIVVGGNLAFCRKMYRSSLVLALSLSLVTSMFIWQHFEAFQISLFANERAAHPVDIVAAVFSIQFASATALAVLLTRSIADGQAESARPDQRGNVRYRNSETALAIVGSLLWLSAVRFDVHFAASYCLYHANALDLPASLPYNIGNLAMLVAVAAACIASCAYARGRALSLSGSPIATMLLILVCGGVLAAFSGSFDSYGSRELVPIGFLWAWALFAMALGWKAGFARGYSIALVCLMVEAFLVSTIAFPSLPERLGSTWAMVFGAVYGTAICALIAWLLHLRDWRQTGTVALAAVSTVLVMSYTANCTPFEVEGWVLSICCMTCALIWVVLGFAMRHGHLRLCGLVVVLLSVAKLVMVDLAGLDSASRTMAYIGGGLICFAVSALYNFATRRFSERESA